MNCPYCGTIMSKEEHRCPRCDKRIVSEEEYFELFSELNSVKEKQKAFRLRVGIALNALIPGLGSVMLTGKPSMLLLALVLEIIFWVLFTGTCLRGNPAYIYLILPIVTRLFTIFATIKEEKD